MLGLEEENYTVFYKNGDIKKFPVNEIKAVRFDVIDKNSRTEKNIKLAGLAAIITLTIAGIIAIISLFSWA